MRGASLAPKALSVPERIALYAQPVGSLFCEQQRARWGRRLLSRLSMRRMRWRCGLSRTARRSPCWQIPPTASRLRQRACFEFDLTNPPPAGEYHPPPTRLTPLQTSGFPDASPDALLTCRDCTLHADSPLLSTSPYRPLPHAEREHRANAVYLLPECTPALALGGAAVRWEATITKWMDVCGAASTGAKVARRACTWR